MRRNLVYFATGIFCIILLTGIFFLGYIVGFNRILLFIGYILAIILVFLGIMFSVNDRKKNLPITNLILEGE